MALNEQGERARMGLSYEVSKKWPKGTGPYIHCMCRVIVIYPYIELCVSSDYNRAMHGPRSQGL